MGQVIGTILENVNVFECEYEKWRDPKESLKSLEVEGIGFRFNQWLKYNNVFDEDIEETYNNLSGVRDGNRIDIMENYKIYDTNFEISYLYSVNGTVWAVLYDKENDSWYGEIEILPV